jgi:hypothetical protein
MKLKTGATPTILISLIRWRRDVSDLYVSVSCINTLAVLRIKDEIPVEDEFSCA